MSALRLSVVGHLNTGKTSLVAALSRRSDLKIAEGRTTTRVQEVPVLGDGGAALTLVDTPGFELASEIRERLERTRAAARDVGRSVSDLELLRELIAKARADSPEPELVVNLDALEAACEADAILYVVDVMEPPLERLRDEVALLTATARPVIGVLNRTAERDTHEEAWREVFREERVPLQVAFNFWVADDATEDELLSKIQAALPKRSAETLRALRGRWASEAARHRSAAIRAIAELLLDAVALRGRAPKSEPEAETAAREDLMRLLREREAEGLAAIGRAHGFSGEEVEAGESAAPQDEILSNDLFDPATWKREVPGLLKLTGGGAATGALVDAFVGGLSIGLGALIGAAAGLVAGITRRVVSVQRRGDIIEAAVHPDFAWVLLARALSCHAEYSKRTHASRAKIEVGAAAPPREAAESEKAREKLGELLRAAARDPKLNGEAELSARRRNETLDELKRELDALVA